MINWEFCVIYLTMHFKACRDVGSALSHSHVILQKVFEFNQRPNENEWFEDSMVAQLCGGKPDKVLYYQVYSYVRDHVDEFLTEG